MATFDFEQQKIVARIVYDGVAHAGKTTNVRHLGDLFTGVRRSEMVVPEERNGRTLWFDWVQLEGGMICGFPLSCQIVTVPGQRLLSHRRRHLLRTADAVVFVADSSRGRARRTREGVEVLRSILDELGPHRPPLVLQANKQDKPDAMSAAALVRALGLPESVPILPARANEGIGVRETLIRVVRTLTDHVQALAEGLGWQLPVRPPEAAADLHAAMIEQDDMADETEEGVTQENDDIPDDAPNEAPSVSVPELLALSPGPTGDSVRSPSIEELAGVVSTRGPGSLPPLPRADARTGDVWPAMTARDVLRELEAAETAAAASPEGPVALRSATHVGCRVGAFIARASSHRRFADSEEARAELIRMARGKSLIGGLLLPGTVLALQRDEDGAWRLWTVHRAVSTLKDLLDETLRAEDEAGAARVLAHFARVIVDAILLASRDHLSVSLALSEHAVLHDRTYYVGDEIGFGSTINGLGESILAAGERAARLPGARSYYFERLEEAMRMRLTRVDVERVGVARALADARIGAGPVRGSIDRLLHAIQPSRAAEVRREVAG
jgi:signal recognition particle receptor subunit beta